MKQNTLVLETAEDTEDKQLQRAAAAYKEFLVALGVDMRDPNVIETPMRVATMFKCELLTGMDESKVPEIKTFPSDDFNPSSDLVIVKKVPLRSTCAHHIMPIVGYADIGAFYLKPKKGSIKYPGLSKYERVLQHYMRRLQLQERIGHQVANHILGKTEAKMVLVRLNAVHHCMCSRGVRSELSNTTTLAIAMRETDTVFMNGEGINSPESVLARFLREVEIS